MTHPSNLVRAGVGAYVVGRQRLASSSNKEWLMAGRLAGKTAFCTASGAGIGRASAMAFAREGARVIATDIDETRMKGLK